jgi:hypothetical protein
MAIIMIAFTNFNLSRLLSPQAAGSRLSHTEATFLLRSLDVLPPDFMPAECATFSRARNTGYNSEGVSSFLNHHRRALIHQIEQFDDIRVPHPDATAARGHADFVLVFGAMNVDEAVPRIGILLV